MSRLELQFGATALPEKVAAAVSLLGTETVTAPRVLSEKLVQRLHEIAAQHGGQVALHTRLFAQFLHHAFPRECPFPIKAGETSPRARREWKDADKYVDAVDRAVSDLRSFESRSEARDRVASDDLPWSDEEEIFAQHHEKTRILGTFWKGTLLLALSLAVVLQFRELFATTSWWRGVNKGMKLFHKWKV